MRISIPFFAHELRERLGKDDQGLQREKSPPSCQFAPKPLQAAPVPRKATNIGMGTGALIEAPLPVGYCRDRCGLSPPHRSCADGASVREIPVGRYSELRFCLGTIV